MNGLKGFLFIFISLLVGIFVEEIFKTSEHLEKIFYVVFVVSTIGMSFWLFRDDTKKYPFGLLVVSFGWAWFMWFLFFELPTH